MKIVIRVPTRKEILQRSLTVPVARDGTSWNKDCLGQFANMSGVYIHSSGSTILYVGKTTRGLYGTYGERLRRECQKKASADSRLYRLLLSQRSVRTAFYPTKEVEKMIQAKNLPRENRPLLLERALIAVYKPGGNRDSQG